MLKPVRTFKYEQLPLSPRLNYLLPTSAERRQICAGLEESVTA